MTTPPTESQDFWQTFVRSDACPPGVSEEQLPPAGWFGDRSLAAWRQAHWRYFSRVLTRIGRTPTETIPLVCQRFRGLYKGQQVYCAARGQLAAADSRTVRMSKTLTRVSADQ